MHKLEKWNTEDTDWTGLNGFYRVPTRYVTAIKLRNTLVPKLQLGNPDDEAPASRDGKLELPTPNSQAGAWELASNCDVGRAVRALHCIPTRRVGTSVSWAFVYNDECGAWGLGREHSPAVNSMRGS